MAALYLTPSRQARRMGGPDGVRRPSEDPGLVIQKTSRRRTLKVSVGVEDWQGEKAGAGEQVGRLPNDHSVSEPSTMGSSKWLAGRSKGVCSGAVQPFGPVRDGEPWFEVAAVGGGCGFFRLPAGPGRYNTSKVSRGRSRDLENKSDGSV